MRSKFPPSSFLHQPKRITRLLHSPSTTTKQLQQIHAQILLLFSSPPTSLSNSLIAAYASSLLPSNAFAIFAARRPFHNPNQFTLQSLLKSSSKSKSITITTQIHSISLKLGFTDYNPIGNAFVHSYCLCGRLSYARKMFDEMPQRDVVSFNSMIHGYAESGDMGSASRLFERAPARNPVTWTAMIAGFFQSGDVSEARRLFDEMPVRDLVSWNAMVSGYVKNHDPLAALRFFRQMSLEKFKPNRVTIVGVLSACADLGALDSGKWMHAFIGKNKYRVDPFLGSALIDMYSKCGAPEFALDVFVSMRERNTCTFNAMIDGLAMNGQAEQALSVFTRMEADWKVKPDEVTFVGVLSACSHGGFVEEGRRHFYFTTKKYGVELILEHYACMVDLLGRCGRLEEAEEIVRTMPITPDVVVLRALLGGCRIHKDLKMAERVVSEMEARATSDYVLLSNLYADVGRWCDVEKVRGVMNEMGVEKTPGFSSIEVDSTIHEFISADQSHPRYEEIHAMLLLS